MAKQLVLEQESGLYISTNVEGNVMTMQRICRESIYNHDNTSNIKMFNQLFSSYINIGKLAIIC